MMKNKILLSILFCLSLFNVKAQCGGSEFCNANSGLYSNNDASSIAYDNMGSGYHSTFIKEPNGVWKVWGEYISNNGVSNVLSPAIINSTNYPALTGTIYKVAIGSTNIFNVQLIVLTSDGLFVLGSNGSVLDSTLTTSSIFQKVTVNGKLDGLPDGMQSTDVKMMFATYKSLILTSCSGEVYVLSQLQNVRGDGLVGDSLQWSKVMINAETPLSNILVARGSWQAGFALKSDGSLWTWGESVYLGNGTVATTKSFATQMTLPSGIPGIKMIQMTTGPSYYVLGTDKKVYALGNNSYGQLGDRTAITRTVWVNAKNPNSSIINDAAWISANEHDNYFSGIAVITNTGKLYTAGRNSSFMAGRLVNNGVNYLDYPAGVSSTDVITFAEAGGHTTALIKQGSIRYGYVGHRIAGSMGNGSSSDITISSFDFITPPIVSVCGSNPCGPVTVSTNSPICPGVNAVFTIAGTAGDVVSYNINNGSMQSVTIGASGSVNVTVNSPTTSQIINLTLVVGTSCSNILSSTATITIGSNVIPTFTQVAPICSGQTLSALPTTSNNSITGTWSPVMNNTQTTIYTFTPTSSCASTTTMTVIVNNNLSTPIFTQVAPICVGQTLNPLPTTSNNGIVGIWSPILDNTQTTVYTFTPTSSCGTSTTMTIQVLSTPITPTFTQVTPICSGQSLNALPTTSNNFITGIWSPSLNNTQTTTYTFTPTLGCSTTTTMTIVVNDNFSTPTFTQVAPICVGQTLSSLPTTSNNGIVGSWSPALDNTQTTIYTFAPTSSCGSTTTMTIVVNPIVAPTFTQVAPICAGQTLNVLPTTSNNGISGTWSPIIDNTLTTTYTFTPSSGCGNTATMTIVVNPIVAPTFTQVAPICAGQTLNALPTTSNNGIAGSWSPAINNTLTTTYTFMPNSGLCANTTQMTIVINPMINPTFTQVAPICTGQALTNLPTMSNNGIAGSWSPVINNTQTTNYTFTPNTGLCANPTQMTIVVNQKVAPTFSTFNPICFGSSTFNFPSVSNNGISGTWSPSLNNTQTATYTFTPNSNECAVPTSQELVVFNDFDFDFKEYCSNGDFMLEIFPVSNSFNINASSFLWEQNSSFVGNNAIFNVTNYLNSNTAQHVPISFNIKVTDSNGCDKSKTIKVDNVYCEIQKGISPNYDGLNDFFDLRLLSVKKLSIFNRYGMKVYSKENYKKEWQGQTDSGTILPDATYYYMIEFENGATKTGWIYLNKEKN